MECAFMARWRSRKDGEGEASRGTMLFCIGPVDRNQSQIGVRGQRGEVRRVPG